MLPIASLFSNPKTPLPWRETVGVRGIKTEVLEILAHYHPHPSLPRRRGGKNLGFRISTSLGSTDREYSQ